MKGAYTVVVITHNDPGLNVLVCNDYKLLQNCEDISSGFDLRQVGIDRTKSDSILIDVHDISTYCTTEP